MVVEKVEVLGASGGILHLRSERIDRNAPMRVDSGVEPPLRRHGSWLMLERLRMQLVHRGHMVKAVAFQAEAVWLALFHWLYEANDHQVLVGNTGENIITLHSPELPILTSSRIFSIIIRIFEHLQKRFRFPASILSVLCPRLTLDGLIQIVVRRKLNIHFRSIII